MTDFTVNGPFPVPVYKGSAGRIVRPAEGATFFRSHTAFSGRKGCYVFGMRAGGGITPMYVGRTKRTFGQECFTHHKIDKYNQCLVDYARGTPVLFFVVPKRRRGAPNKAHIAELEKFLIQTGVAVNPDLLNVQGTRLADWSITGVLRGTRGRPSRSAALFRSMMSL